MNKTVLAALLLAAAAQAPAQDPEKKAECRYRAEALPASPVKKSSIEILGSTPAAGADVRRESVVELDVEYHLADFKPESFYLLAMYSTAGRGARSTHDPEDSPALETAHGRVHFCLPLEKAYALPTVKFPFELQLLVSRGSGSFGTVTVLTRPLVFNPVDLTPEQIARKDAAPPLEYVDALMKVTQHFDSRAARYQQCIRRFPATQPALTKIYRAWETRHWKAIEFASQRLFDYYSQLADQPAHATQLYDHARGMQASFYEKITDAQLKQECQYMREDMIEADDITNDAIADELEVLRAWQPKKS